MALEATDSINIMAPAEITDAMIVSSTISPEDSAPAWNSGTTYALGNVVYMASTHRRYESLQAGNLNKDPSVLANQFNSAGEGTWWLDLGPTNLWAMFDSMVSTASSHASPLTVVLKPGAFNGFALFGLDGDHIHITARETTGGPIYYEYDADLEDSAPPDYYEYFFDPFKPQTQFIATGLPPFAMAEITVTITRGTGECKIGMFAIGLFSSIGAPLRGATAEPIDYSYIQTDQFGVTTIKKRHNATGLTISGKSDVEEAGNVLSTVKRLLGTPCVVIGSIKENYGGLTVFGLVSGRMVYAPDNAVDEVTLNLTVKGLI